MRSPLPSRNIHHLPPLLFRRLPSTETFWRPATGRRSSKCCSPSESASSSWTICRPRRRRCSWWRSICITATSITWATRWRRCTKSSCSRTSRSPQRQLQLRTEKSQSHQTPESRPRAKITAESLRPSSAYRSQRERKKSREMLHATFECKSKSPSRGTQWEAVQRRRRGSLRDLLTSQRHRIVSVLNRRSKRPRQTAMLINLHKSLPHPPERVPSHREKSCRRRSWEVRNHRHRRTERESRRGPKTPASEAECKVQKVSINVIHRRHLSCRYKMETTKIFSDSRTREVRRHQTPHQPSTKSTTKFIFVRRISKIWRGMARPHSTATHRSTIPTLPRRRRWIPTRAHSSTSSAATESDLIVKCWEGKRWSFSVSKIENLLFFNSFESLIRIKSVFCFVFTNGSTSHEWKQFLG